MMKQLLLKQFHWLIDDRWAQSSGFLNFHLILLHVMLCLTVGIEI